MNTYFEKHMPTAASDHSFTVVMYLFKSVSLQLQRKTMIFRGEEDFNRVTHFLKDMSKSFKYAW